MQILRSCHIDTTAGHLGEKKTVSRISERFIWTGMPNKWYIISTSKFACTFVSALCITFRYLHVMFTLTGN